MTRSKKPYKPRVVTANDLYEGDVTYLTVLGDWTRDLAFAAVAETPEHAERLLKMGQAQPDQVVGPYLAEMGLDADGTPHPVHFRERFRTLGPSNRPDLGKQAEPRGSAAIAAE